MFSCRPVCKLRLSSALVPGRFCFGPVPVFRCRYNSVVQMAANQRNFQMTYALLITEAHPDYKRPRSTSTLDFFETRELAESAAEIYKRNYRRYKGFTKQEFESGKYADTVYNENYMEQPPFSVEIIQVKAKTSLTQMLGSFDPDEDEGDSDENEWYAFTYDRSHEIREEKENEKNDGDGVDAVANPQTLLEAITTSSNIEVVNEAIAKFPQQLNCQDEDGETALMAGVRSVRGDVVHVLVKAGADLELRNNDGESACMIAASSLSTINRQSIDCFETLVSEGANLEARDVNGKTALLRLCTTGDGKAQHWVGYLVSRGANVNVQDSAGNTPLMLACMRDDEYQAWQVRRLLFLGADPTIANHEGESPSILKFSKHSRIPKFLAEHTNQDDSSVVLK